MLGWAIAFLVAALAVGALGVEASATTLAAMSKVLFFVFLAGMVVSLALHFSARKRI
jgi:uncharacterized membrane protein YtjA (UPF0391 family)